jgi:hypothetical protein
MRYTFVKFQEPQISRSVKHSVDSINAKQQPEPSMHFSGAIRPNFAEIDPHP